MRPDTEQLHKAVNFLVATTDYLWWFIEDESEQNWSKAMGYLQDALAELGYDLLPLKQKDTTVAYFDDAAYARDRGGV